MNYYSSICEYPSREHSVYGKRDMLATIQPIVAQTGLEIIQKGSMKP